MAEVELGFILRAHGLRGWVRCRAGASLRTLKRVIVDGKPCEIEGVSPDKDEWLLKLAGVADRNAAEALAGASLRADRDWLPEAADDEVYLADLVGCRLVDLHGSELGVVRGTTPGAQELLDCETPTGRPFQVPFVPALVPEVRLAERTLVCDLPIGLVNLDDAEEA